MSTRKNKTNVVLENPNINDNIIESNVYQVEAASRPLWGGYFGNNLNELSKKTLSTLHQDKRLYQITIESLKAQLKMNVKRNIIAEDQSKVVAVELDQLKRSIADGNLAIDNATNIREFIIMQIKKQIGHQADVLDLAKSHHDQISGDLKVWVKDACDSMDGSIQNLQAALIDKAEENVRAVMPGYTHMQTGSPISLGHALMSHVEMLGRDRDRFKDARIRMNKSPYGANDLGGTAFFINRESVSRAMGFEKVAVNSVDAVSDRDYVVEFLSAASICAMHLSRLAEDLLLWQSPRYNFISFSDAFVKQDTVIPSKRDPEVIEVVRARTGKIFGSLVNALTTLKSLPATFTQDLAELAEPSFEAFDTLYNSLNISAALIADFIINRKKMKEAAQSSYSTAPDLRDWLVLNTGCSQSEAEIKTRKILQLAANKKKKLSLLELDELRSVDSKITDDVYSVLITSRSIITKRSVGGANPVQVRKCIRIARRQYL